MSAKRGISILPLQTGSVQRMPCENNVCRLSSATHNNTQDGVVVVQNTPEHIPPQSSSNREVIVINNVIQSPPVYQPQHQQHHNLSYPYYNDRPCFYPRPQMCYPSPVYCQPTTYCAPSYYPQSMCYF